jgi:hypothetical protein
MTASLLAARAEVIFCWLPGLCARDYRKQHELHLRKSTSQKSEILERAERQENRVGKIKRVHGPDLERGLRHGCAFGSCGGSKQRLKALGTSGPTARPG